MFFWLHDADLPEALCCAPRDYSFAARSVMRGERLPDDTVTFEENIGEIAFDIVCGGFAGLDLWSERAMEAARANRITGLRSYRVEIRRDDGSVLTNYEGLAVTGRCGPIDDSRGAIEQRILVAGAPPYRYHVGLFVEQDSWDGSDLFVPPNLDLILCTSRLKTVFEEACITNVAFTPIERVEIPIP
jgi:hypothetical protein